MIPSILSLWQNAELRIVIVVSRGNAIFAVQSMISK